MSRLLVWDASPIVHASRVDRVDVLGDMARGPGDAPWDNCTTAAVAGELSGLGVPVPSWLAVEHVDGLDEVVCLARWVGLVSAQRHHRGEATVLAYAECRSATAIIDDRDARTVGQRHGLAVHGSLWVFSQAVQQGRWNARSVSNFVDQLLAAGAFYPFEPGGYPSWATEHGLLAPSA